MEQEEPQRSCAARPDEGADEKAVQEALRSHTEAPRSHMKASFPSRSSRAPRVISALILVLLWCLIDQLSKAYVKAGWQVGDHIAGPFAGLFEFRLVHNTGMAWGLFGDATTMLGIFSCVVCLALFAFLVYEAPRLNRLQHLGISLVLAGGVSNAIDRFALGYVVDFIEFSFIDFPVFNVADIAVTCGFVILLIGFIIAWRREDTQATSAASTTSTSAKDGR